MTARYSFKHSLRHSLRPVWGLVSVVLLLSACATDPAPVGMRKPPASERIRHHIVAKGETLYGIAWRYEIAPDQLARANDLVSPYSLRAGQRLNLDISRSSSRSPTSSPTSSASGRSSHTVARGDTLYSIARRYRLPLDKLAAANGLTAPYILQLGQRLSLNVARASSRTKSSTTRKTKTSRQTATNKTSAKLPAAGWKWRWPTKGKVTRFYDSNRVFKGINIQSRAGHAVIAAAPGVVVYAGDGLRGYGRLVIVKHSETYLSAYAHNRKILVKEGEQVTSTSKIAEVGGNSANPGRLYFEIRKNGKPVDPLRLLPTQ